MKNQGPAAVLRQQADELQREVSYILLTNSVIYITIIIESENICGKNREKYIEKLRLI